MRRKEKEITDPNDLEKILQQAKILRLGIHDEKTPYIIPVHYGYHNGELFIHSAKEGKKITLLRKNPQISFELELDHTIQNTGIPCNWSTTYQSIIGSGTASFINTIEEKKKALEILVDHYAQDTHYDFSKKMIKSVEVIKITIEHMTGKQSIE